MTVETNFPKTRCKMLFLYIQVTIMSKNKPDGVSTEEYNLCNLCNDNNENDVKRREEDD